MGAGFALARGVTIAVRYSCVRQQGFVDAGAASAAMPTAYPEERQIMDYQVQALRYVVFRDVSGCVVMSMHAVRSIGYYYRTVWIGCRQDLGATDDSPCVQAVDACLHSALLCACTCVSVCTWMCVCANVYLCVFSLLGCAAC